METYQLNIWNVQLLNNLPKFSAVKSDFKKNLLVSGTKYSRMDQMKCDLVEDNLLKQIISLQIFWRLSSTSSTSSILEYFVTDNPLVKILIDTGAKVSMSGEQQAKIWEFITKWNHPLQKYTHIMFCKFQKSSCASRVLYFTRITRPNFRRK